MKITRLFIFFFLLFSVHTLSAQNYSKSIDLKDFTKLQIGSVFNVTIKKGDFKITLTGNQDEVEDVRAEVKNSELSFYFKEKKIRTSKIMITIFMPQLQAVNFSGTVKATVENGFNYDNFTIYLSGTTEATVNIETSKIFVDISGTGVLNLKGKGTEIQANVSGIGSLNGFDFSVESARLDVSGTSGARITVAKSLNASATGTSKIRYKGTPTNIISNAKGLSSIKKQEN